MERNNKTILYCSALIIGLSLIAGFLIYPLFKQVEAGSARLKNKQNKVAELEIQSKQLDKLKQEYQNSKSGFNELDNLFINPEAPIRFLKFLEQTASDSDVKVKINPSSGRKTDQEPWPPSFFEISGSGSFDNCVEFITKLEYAPYLLQVQRLKLDKNEQSIKFNLSLKVY